MKKTSLLFGVFILFIILTTGNSYAQTPDSARFIVKNVQKSSIDTIYFDLYLYNNGTVAFNYVYFQAAIDYSATLFNGGKRNILYVNGSSGLTRKPTFTIVDSTPTKSVNCFIIGYNDTLLRASDRITMNVGDSVKLGTYKVWTGNHTGGFHSGDSVATHFRSTSYSNPKTKLYYYNTSTTSTTELKSASAYSFEVQLSSVMNITVVIEGYLSNDGGVLHHNARDTIKAYLRGATFPYNFVDSSVAIIDSLTFTGSFKFDNAPNGTYFVVIRHRNALETWSKLGGEAFAKGTTMNYNFSSNATQAYGSNMKSVLGKWCIYSGDVSDGSTVGLQDGFIEIADMDAVYTDQLNSVEGWAVTDLNADLFTEIADMDILYTNQLNSVERQVPPDLPGFVSKKHIKLDKNQYNNYIKSIQDKKKVNSEKQNLNNKERSN